MATASATANLFHHVPFLSFLLLSKFAFPCPIEVFNCNSYSTNEERYCGNNKLKCENSNLKIQFNGQGPFYRAGNITFPEKKLKIWADDPRDKLSQKNCDFFYNFTSPIRGFNASAIPTLNSTATFFNCDDNSYSFKGDVFWKYYHSSCSSYDLMFTYHPEKFSPPSGDNCTVNGSTSVEWELSFEVKDDNDVEFSLVSVGFSHAAKRIVGKMVLIGLFAFLGFFLLFAGGFLWIKHRKKERTPSTKTSLIRSISSEHSESISTHHIFTNKELEDATDVFSSSKELGDGGFGAVYKGINSFLGRVKNLQQLISAQEHQNQRELLNFGFGAQIMTLQILKLLANKCATSTSTTTSPSASPRPSKIPSFHLRRHGTRKRNTLRCLLTRCSPRRRNPLPSPSSEQTRSAPNREEERGLLLRRTSLKDLFMSSASPPAVSQGGGVIFPTGWSLGFQRQHVNGERSKWRSGGGVGYLRYRLLRRVWRPVLVTITE